MRIVLKMKRAETPFYAALERFALSSYAFRSAVLASEGVCLLSAISWTFLRSSSLRVSAWM
jgi:hypothetical protein